MLTLGGSYSNQWSRPGGSKVVAYVFAVVGVALTAQKAHRSSIFGQILTPKRSYRKFVLACPARFRNYVCLSRQAQEIRRFWRVRAWFLAQNIEHFFIGVAGRRGYFVRAVKTLAGMARGERCRQSSFSWQAPCFESFEMLVCETVGGLDLALGLHVA